MYGSNSGANDELTTLDVDDDLAEGDEPLPFEIPTGHVLVSSAPATLTAALVRRLIVLRLGIGWLKRAITRQAQARTRHLYDDETVFVDRDGSTHSVRLPLAKGSWALLECLAHTGGFDEESQEGAAEGCEEENEGEDEEKEEDEEEDGINDAEPVESGRKSLWPSASVSLWTRGGVDRTVYNRGTW